MYKVLAVQVRSLESYVKKYDDFPNPGVSFCDIVPLLNGHFSEAIQAMSDLTKILMVCGILDLNRRGMKVLLNYHL